MKVATHRTLLISLSRQAWLNLYNPWIRHLTQILRIRLHDALVRTHHRMTHPTSLCALPRKSGWTGLEKHVRVRYLPLRLVLTDASGRKDLAPLTTVGNLVRCHF